MNSESRHEPTDPSGAKPQASQSPVVRRALPSERSAVAAMVAAAFSADPAWTFIFGSEYERLAQHFAAALFDVRVNSSTVWVTDDLAAVAMWDSPGKSAESPEYAEEVWKRYRATSGAEAYLRLLAYNDAVMAVAATAAGDYWYLGVLATHPEHRREGLASAVLAPVLEEADRQRIVCCLETSTEENRRFYERRGFTLASDVLVPGGPATWWLRRAPAQC
jgi:ribosomal protein S18 acetylase RimI-like enzyme